MLPKKAVNKTSKSPSWLASYNFLCAGLWSVTLITTVYFGWTIGQPALFEKTNWMNTLIQTVAIVEVYNSAVGNVRSPLVTAVIQVSSRLLVVWGVFQVLPNSPANYHWLYITLLLSWSITEIIRYSYYGQNLVSGGETSKILTYLRYTTFYVLYPTGAGSEWGMIYLSLNEASKSVGDWYALFLKAILLIYIPGFYVMYTHMIGQRKKVFKKQKQN